MKKILIGLLIAGVAWAGIDLSNKFKLGDALHSIKIIEADRGAGASNPKLKWNEGTQTWQFCNDGVTCTDMGTGGGGSTPLSGVLVGSVYFPEASSCVWTNFGVVQIWGSFAAAPSCVMPTGANVIGNNIGVPSGHNGILPAIDLYNVDTTKMYKIKVNGFLIDVYISNYAHTVWRLYDQKDAIATSPEEIGFTGSINNGIVNSQPYETELKFTTGGTHTLELQCSNMDNAGGACQAKNDAPAYEGYANMTITVYQYDILP